MRPAALPSALAALALLAGCGGGSHGVSPPQGAHDEAPPPPPTGSEGDSAPGWPVVLESAQSAEVVDVAVGPDGAVFLTGLFSGTVDFDPGPGLDRRTPEGESHQSDAFLLKLDAEARFEWVRTFHADYVLSDHDVAAGPDGSVVLSATFEGTVDLDPGPGEARHEAGDDLGVLVVRLDADGELLFGASLEGSPRDVAVAADGSVVVIGAFGGTVDLDPGDGVSEHSVPGTNAGTFVVRLEPAGALRWARSLGGSGSVHGGSVAAGPDGLVVTGTVEGEVDLDPGPAVDARTSAGRQVFVMSLDEGGARRWVGLLEGAGSSGTSGLAVAADGSVVVGGFFEGTVDLDPSQGEDRRSAGEGGAGFIARLDRQGSAEWVRTYGGSEVCFIRDLAVGADGSCVAVGLFREPLDLDPTQAVVEVTPRGPEDLFLLHLDAGGELLWSGTIGGPSDEGIIQRVVAAPDGTYLLSSDFVGTVDLDPDPSAVSEHRGTGMRSSFVTRLALPAGTGGAR